MKYEEKYDFFCLTFAGLLLRIIRLLGNTIFINFLFFLVIFILFAGPYIVKGVNKFDFDKYEKILKMIIIGLVLILISLGF